MDDWKWYDYYEFYVRMVVVVLVVLVVSNDDAWLLLLLLEWNGDPSSSSFVRIVGMEILGGIICRSVGIYIYIYIYILVYELLL